MAKDMFIDPLKSLPSYKNLLEEIKKGTSPIGIHGLNEENVGHLVYGLNNHADRQVLVIASDELKAKKIFEDLKNFQNENVEFFPSRELVFYDIEAFSFETIHQRLKVLSRLINKEKVIVVTYIEAILNKIMTPDIFEKYKTSIKYGQTVELDKLVQSFVYQGYERVAMVEGKGQFSVRGGIIDFFSTHICQSL